MSRASNLAGFGSFIGPPDDLNVGIVTAVSYYGDGSSLTGIDATSLKDGNGTVRVQANTSGAVVTGILTATSFTAGGAVVTVIGVSATTSVSNVNIWSILDVNFPATTWTDSGSGGALPSTNWAESGSGAELPPTSWTEAA